MFLFFKVRYIVFKFIYFYRCMFIMMNIRDVEKSKDNMFLIIICSVFNKDDLIII